MSIARILMDASTAQPEKIALICDQRQTSYLSLQRHIAQVAGGLQALGVTHGQPVALLALNSDLYIESFFGILWQGAVASPLNTRWSAAEISYALHESNAEVIFIDQHFLPLLESLKHSCPQLKTVIYLGSDEQTVHLDFLHFKTWRDRSPYVETPASQMDDLAVILYTGGTTGRAKGVMLSHQNFLSNAYATFEMAHLRFNGTVLHVAPLFHVAGIAALIQTMIRQSTVIVIQSFQPLEVFKSIETYQVDEAFFVPTMLQMLLNHPDISQYSLGSLRTLIYAASAMDPNLLQHAMKTFAQTDFIQFYGMTELSPIVTILDVEQHKKQIKLRSVGYPTSQSQVKIIDQDGQQLKPYQVGEIVVRGSHVMMGYWNKPQETAQALREGWMHTGDGGYLDEDGFLYIVDRIKDMIISGGENIYSIEVENALLKHPDILMCAVIGLPDPLWGEIVHAVIVLHPERIVENDALIQHCRTLIAPYKCPRSFEFRSALPLSGAGKILKHVLRKEKLAATQELQAKI